MYQPTKTARLLHALVIMALMIALASGQVEQMSKLEYYNTYVAPMKKRPPILSKIFGFEDRKRSVLDIGNLIVRLSNAATLGYDRWGLNHEFPAGSMATFQCCTYYWTLSPMIGGLLQGQASVAVGVRGTYRDHEEEFEPLPGYDADYVDEEANVGIAFNDKPASWPAAWPIETDPSGKYTDAVTQQSFEGIERPLDQDHPEGSGLRFPGVSDGKVVAKRETYFVVTDNDPDEGNTLASNGVGPLNVRVDMWGLQYDDILNQDFVIWWERFTNVGSDTLREVFVGLVGDPDTPEQGGAEWTDDYSVFIERGDAHLAEKLADTTDSELLWDLAVIWDGDDKAEGFLSSGVGWIGLKALKTPYTQTADDIDNDLDGVIDEGFDALDNDGDGEIDEEDEQEEMGVTNYFPFPYSLDAQSDNDAYFTQIRGGFGKENSSLTGYRVSPHADDVEQKPYAYGPDITVVMTSGPFTMAPGQSLDFVFADILGVNESDLLNNARTAQLLFNADFKAPRPPDEPVVYGVAGDGEITLYWDPFPSEYSVDPFTGNNAFEGYRVYKSADRGATWGGTGDPSENVITDPRGNTVFYVPQAIYDVVNLWSGDYPYGSPPVYYNLGSNSGLQYTFTDKNVINGLEYWYAVSAFDHPDGIVPPMENPPKKSRGDALASGNNTVILIPQAKPAGWQEGLAEEPKHLEGNSTAQLSFEVYDVDRLEGYDYLITISDDLDDTDDTTKSLSVLNDHTFTISTEIAKTGTKLPHRNILEQSVVVTGPGGEQFVAGADYAIDVEEGKIYALEDTANVTPPALEKGTFYSVSYKYYPVFESTLMSGEVGNPAFESIRLVVQDVDSIFQDTVVTHWYNPNNPDSVAATNWKASMSILTTATTDDYLIIFTTDSSETYIPKNRKIPIQIWNVTDSVRIERILKEPPPPKPGGPINSGDKIKIREPVTEGGSLVWTWQFQLFAPDPATLSDSMRATVLWDTTREGNGVFDWNDDNENGLHDEGEYSEPFTDLDSSGAWDAGEPFVDCYFDTATALIGFDELIAALFDTLPQVFPGCEEPDTSLDTTYRIMPWPFFNEQTSSYDTTRALRVKAKVSAACDTSIAPVVEGNGQYDEGEYFTDLDSSGTWDVGEPYADVGDAIYIATTKPLTPKDVYLIQTSKSTATVSTKDQLKEVKVVPNPYVSTSAYEINIETKEIQFTNLPQECTIRIFTIAGELLRIIEHKEGSNGWRGPSVEAWDLRTYNNQEVAFGIYIFHVEAEGVDDTGRSKTFSELGKFAIIR